MRRQKWQQGYLEKRGKRRPVWFARYRITEMTPSGTITQRQVGKVIGTVAELPTERAARVRLLQIIEAEGSGPRIAATFGELADRWQRTILPLFKPATRRSYASILRLYLRPRFGDMALADVQTFEVQSLISDLSARLAPESCKRVWDLLSGIYRKAVEWRWVRENPCRGVSLPRRFRRPQRAVDSQTLARVVAELGEPYATLLILIAATGLRRSEVVALRWQSVEWHHGLLCVSENLVNGEWGTPKGRLEPMLMPVSEWVLERLRKLRDWYGDVAGPEQVIFASRAGTPLSPSNILNRHLWPACDRVGVRRFSFHALRRGLTTEQVGQGTDVITMQHWLGHKDPQTTLRHYAMADAGRMRAAVNAWGEKLFTTVHQNGQDAANLNNTESQVLEKAR